MPKLRHYDDTGTVRFVTFNCFKRMPFLNNDESKEILIDEIQSARQKHQFKIAGYVIMPNHVHLVMLPPEGMKLGLVIGEIKSRAARMYFVRQNNIPEGNRVFWQKRCYDHNCRSTEVVIEKIKYCHKNPVKSGLVRDPANYAWSSYNWYRGNREIPLAIDEIEL